MGKTALVLGLTPEEISVAEIEDLAARAEVEISIKRVPQPPAAPQMYWVRVDDDFLGAERLRQELVAFGADPFVRYDTSFTASEIDEAPLCAVFSTRAPRGLGGPTHGSQFDLSEACPACGTGARLVGDFIFRSSDLPKKGEAFRTLDGELLVADTLRDRLIGAQVRGLEFHDVRSSRTGEREPWSLVVAPHTLPPMSDLTDGIIRERPCPTCQRDGFFDSTDTVLAFRYDLTEADVDALPDFASTWECFGNSRIADPFEKSHFAQPRLVAKPRVARLLQTGENLELAPIALTSVGASAETS